MLLQWGEQDECPIYWSRLGWQERRTWMGADDGDDDVEVALLRWHLAQLEAE